jgi:hypothetical protein
MKDAVSLRRAWLWASVSMACVTAFGPSGPGQCRKDSTVLNAGEDWSKFMSVSDGAAQNSGTPDPFERMKKRPPKSLGGATGLNYEASYPEAPNSGNYEPPSDDYFQQDDRLSSSSSYNQNAPPSSYETRPTAFQMEEQAQDQTSPVWSSFMTVADGPTPIPDPVTRRREEEMARQRQEEQRQWQQFQQQQQQQQSQSNQQQQNGTPPFQPPMPPYGPPFAPFPMQQPPPFQNFGPPFAGAAVPFGGSNGGFPNPDRPSQADPYKGQQASASSTPDQSPQQGGAGGVEDSNLSESERARAVVQARMAAEMAKFEREMAGESDLSSFPPSGGGAASDTSPTAWWETLQAKQDAKDNIREDGDGSGRISADDKGDAWDGESRKWSATMPQPPSSGAGGFNNPWRPQSRQMTDMPRPPIPFMIQPPDTNNAWTPDSGHPPDRAPGYWSEYMAVSDGPEPPKTYEEQKAMWERARRREQQERLRRQEFAQNPHERVDSLQDQVEQQQAEQRARWENEQLMELEAQVQERNMERKQSLMSVDDGQPLWEQEQKRAISRLEQAERMAQAMVEQEIQRAAAVERYRDLRNQVEAERQYRSEEEARARARSQIDHIDDDMAADAREMDDAIDVDIEQDSRSGNDDGSNNTLETLMLALEDAKRKVEEEKKKVKYNEKAKAQAAAEEWEAAVARARAKIMAEDIIKSKKPSEEQQEGEENKQIPDVKPKSINDQAKKSADTVNVKAKTMASSEKPTPTKKANIEATKPVEDQAKKSADTVDVKAKTMASSEKATPRKKANMETIKPVEDQEKPGVDVVVSSHAAKNDKTDKKDVKTVVLNGVTIVSDPSLSEPTSEANDEPEVTIDGVAVTAESAEKGSFEFFDSAESMKNGKVVPASTDADVDPADVPPPSKRQYFKNRIEETRRRAMMTSASVEKPDVEQLRITKDGRTVLHGDPDLDTEEGSTNAEFFAHRIAEGRKRDLLDNLKAAKKSSDSPPFLKADSDEKHPKSKSVSKDVDTKTKAEGKKFSPQRLEERRKLALLASLLQELPDLLRSDEDDEDDPNEEDGNGNSSMVDLSSLESIAKKHLKHNGRSSATKRKNGVQQADSSKSSSKRNGVQKAKAEDDVGAESSSDADFEDVKKIFKETANKLGKNGSSKTFLRTIGKNSNGTNETNADSTTTKTESKS